jgi:multidrug efflux system outer membrane protein
MVTLTLAFSACALKAPPTPGEIVGDALPNMRIPAKWAAESRTGDAESVDWLKSFGDPRLSALVAEALAYNADLHAGAARVEQAVAALKIAGASLSPAVDILGRAAHKTSGGGGTDVTGVIISASWEIDLWGRIRYGRQAAQEQAHSAAADYAFARQSIVALVAKSWFVAAETAVQQRLARDSVAASERVSELARERVRIGTGNERDVSLADASLNTYRDALRQIDLARVQALRALEVLAGRYPAAVLEAAADLASLPPAVDSGLPAQLLERRPDVIAAERRVAAAFNRVEEARAARFPNLSLTAALNWIKSTRFILQDRDNPGSSIGGLLTWPFLTGGAIEGQIEGRTAEQKRAVSEYASVGLRAFNEVESAMAAEATLVEREKLLRQAVDHNARTVSLSEVQFRVGRIDLRAILTDQLQLYASKVQLLRVQSEALAQRVNLHLALGGGVGEPRMQTQSAPARVAESDPGPSRMDAMR